MRGSLLDKLIRHNLYLLVFLVPIFFLPLTIWPVALNKQILLSFLALFCLILWLIKIFSEGRLSIVWNKTVFLVLAMILVFGLSTFFSGARAQSFWGMNIEPDSFLNFLLFGLVFFLISNLLKKPKEILNVLFIFLVSSGVLSLFFLIQIFLRKPLFPWSFSQSIAFNSIGTVQALGLFLGAAFVLLMAVAINTLNNAEQHAEETLKRMTAEKNADQDAEKTLNLSALSQRINQRKFSVKGVLKRVKPIFSVVLGILLFTSILLINYWLIWLGVALCLVIIMAEKSKALGQSPAQHQNEQGNQNNQNNQESFGAGFSQKDLKGFILPLIILCLALLAIFIRLPSDRIINLPPEVALTQKTGLDIAFKTLKESGKNLILGSGPATFGYQYSLYRPGTINLTDFWQVRFNQGNSFFFTFLATSGILGFFVILLLILVFFLQGLKLIYKSNPVGEATSENQRRSAYSSALFSGHQLAVFTGGVYLFVLWFFYPFNFVLGFCAFLFLGLWVSAFNQRLDQREISVIFTQSPQKAFFTMMLCVILIVGSGVCLYHLVQKYRAALIFSQGLSSQELDDAIAKINQAALLDQKDDYFRNLSELFLIKMNEVVNNQELEQEQKKQLFQQVVSNAEMSAATAVKINPKNSQNWLQLANVYENLAVFGVEGAIDLAISNYEKTKQMDPQNPQIPLNMGRVYKAELERAKIKIAILEQAENRDEQEFEQTKIAYQQYFDLSMEYFKKSIELKPNFSASYFLLAQNYETNDEKEKALENYKIVLQLEPGNEEIKAKIEELSH